MDRVTIFQKWYKRAFRDCNCVRPEDKLVVFTAFYTDFFYNVIIAWALHFFFASFTFNLPWASCNNTYNSPACYEPTWSNDGTSECLTQIASNENTTKRISAVEEYFYKSFLGLHEPSVPDSHVYRSLSNLGPINWEIALCLLITYLICYVALFKGIKMSGKVVWFTAIFPYVVLGILLIRGVTLPGAATGIEYYLRPNFDMLWKASVWSDASIQVFFSLGPGFGVLMAYSSYNDFHNNLYFDALLTSTINCLTSFLSGFVIFAVLGYMSCKSGKPISEVAQEGPGLVFVVYPEALAAMPGATIWSIIFFLMLLTLGLDSSFGGSEAIITALSDEYPIIKRNRAIFIAILFSFYMIVGMFMCTKGGMLIMEWVIIYGTTWGLLTAVLIEIIVISYVYGLDQFLSDYKEMLRGREAPYFFKLAWRYFAPTVLFVMVSNSIINYTPLVYQDYEYSTLSNMLGLLFALSSISAIPITAIVVIYKQKGNTFGEKFRKSLISTAKHRQRNDIML